MRPYPINSGCPLFTLREIVNDFLLNSNPPLSFYATKKGHLLVSFIVAEKEGFEPSLRLSHTTPLAGEPLRPLGYFSLKSSFLTFYLLLVNFYANFLTFSFNCYDMLSQKIRFVKVFYMFSKFFLKEKYFYPSWIILILSSIIGFSALPKITFPRTAA